MRLPILDLYKTFVNTKKPRLTKHFLPLGKGLFSFSFSNNNDSQIPAAIP